MVQQHGQSNVGCLLTLMVLIVLGYGGYKFGPPLVNNFQLRNTVSQIADYSAAGVLSETKYAAGQRRGSIEEIEEAVVVAARELTIPLLRENVSVQKGTDAVFITVEYTVPVYVVGRIYNWDFRFTGQN